MPRLRRVSPAAVGWTRRRAGSGFVYLDEDNARLDPDLAVRCKALAIPPAWEEVWICPLANGHIQAVGTDAAGRRQYLYHPDWRVRRDAAKFVRVRAAAGRLPAARKRAAADLDRDGMPKERALATAFQLLDLGLFRIGGEAYAEDNGSYGLATVERSHVERHGRGVSFDYPAKSGQERVVVVTDAKVVAAVAAMTRRRGGGPELLAYRERGRWHDVTSADINEYVKHVVGHDASAKDFRTWHGTVLAAVALAERADASTKTARARAVREAVATVADDLGNTAAVARGSYIDPAVIDGYRDGVTIAGTLRRIGPRVGPDRRRERVEKAVLRMLKKGERR